MPLESTPVEQFLLKAGISIVLVHDHRTNSNVIKYIRFNQRKIKILENLTSPFQSLYITLNLKIYFVLNEFSKR